MALTQQIEPVASCKTPHLNSKHTHSSLAGSMVVGLDLFPLGNDDCFDSAEAPRLLRSIVRSGLRSLKISSIIAEAGDLTGGLRLVYRIASQ